HGAHTLNHNRIEEEDIKKGLEAYSTDLLTDISYEINDVEEGVEDILYAFIQSSSELKRLDVKQALLDYGVEEGNIERIFNLLIWYGFLGINVSGNDKYIFDFNYSMNLMLGIIKKKVDIDFTINPAFWPALLIEN
ncbi:P-loop ATPase, Sll1717 family, partial [Vibrio anguillarum]